MDRLSKLFLIIAGIGIPDAIYHAYGEITAYSAPGSTACNINNVFSCENVFLSGYTKFLGLSLWVYGVVWFPLILILGYWFVKKYGALRFEIMIPLLMVGNIFTVYPLWYYEFTKIHSFCLVCISMYCLNYIMTAIALFLYLRDD
jgi:uncharacterized membrane protein